MSSKKRFTSPVTAGELLAELQRDPNYVQMLREKDEQLARNQIEFQEQEKPVLEELLQVGMTVPSIGNSALLEPYLPLSAEAVEVLIRWVPIAPPRVQECIVQLLGAAGTPFDGRVLTELFDRTDSNHLRWIIANTLELAKPCMVADWLEHKLITADSGDALRPLFKAFTLIAERNSILVVARKLLEAIPDAASAVIAKHGDGSDVPALRRMIDREAPSVQRKLTRAIAKIQERERRQSRVD